MEVLLTAQSLKRTAKNSQHESSNKKTEFQRNINDMVHGTDENNEGLNDLHEHDDENGENNFDFDLEGINYALPNEQSNLVAEGGKVQSKNEDDTLEEKARRKDTPHIISIEKTRCLIFV